MSAATADAVSSELPAYGLRALALDIDGTVLSAEHVVTERTARAVRRAVDAGIAVFLTSARHPAGLAPVQADLGLQDSWFVACQGAFVGMRARDGQLIALSEARIDPYQALGIEELAFDLGLSVGRFTADRWLVRKFDAPIEDEAAITGATPEMFTGDLLDASIAPHKMIVACRRDDDCLALEDFAMRLPDTLTGTFSHSYMLEVTVAGVDKLTGLQAVLRNAGITLSQTAAIGDGHNDIPMLLAAGYSFAMGNASTEVQRAARWVTAPNSHHGVADAIDLLLPQHP